MRTYLIRRILQFFLTCWIVTGITFSLLYLGTDPVRVLAGPEATTAELESMRKAMGLDKPVIFQYVIWLGGVLRGDFGQSFSTNNPAISDIMDHFPATFILAVSALILSITISIPLGILASIKRNSFLDAASTLIAVMGQAMPLFWFGIMLIILFGVKLRILPISGIGSWKHLVLPAITLGYSISPLTMRLTRSSMLDVLITDYIRAAWAKGVPPQAIYLKHALKNAIPPVIRIVALQLGALMGGAVVTETVFAWPGVGRLAVSSIQAGDFPVAQGIIIILTFVFVTVNFIADITVAYLDPRIRLK